MALSANHPRTSSGSTPVAALAAAAITLLALACDVAPETDTAADRPRSPAVADPGVDLTLAPTASDDGLGVELDLLRDGLLGVASEPALAERVRSVAALNAAEGGDYEVSLATLKAEAASLDLDLDVLLAEGVLARGGSDEDAAHVVAIAGGFECGDVFVQPMIFVPTMDVDYFGNDAWDGAPPSFVSTERAVVGDEVEVVDLGGASHLVAGGDLLVETAWIVSYHTDEGTSGERFWARCDCVRITLDTNDCRRSGSPSGHGMCGRTGLIGDDCNQTSSCSGPIPSGK
ncbi:MAG: hypothetical protein H6710_01660 [Myxococcales bacterium]|nr:hypothetical protein [Myxococcales bacterium]MCB9702891.1 hypothetical protein [Myxococcales bacterium]